MLKMDEIEKDEWVYSDDSLSTQDHEALDEAIDLWHLGDLYSAELILKTLINENTQNIDAYHHLSLVLKDSGSTLEAYLCCREAVRIGISVMPNNFSWASSKLSWGCIENRPFLRAFHNLGLHLSERGELSESIQIYNRMLSICPNDNIGVRYLLPRLWFKSGDLLSIIRLSEQYADDYSPEFMYNKTLAFVLLGERDKALNAYKVAKSAFPLVSKELKKKRHTKPKSNHSGYISVGSSEEAYEYWSQYGEFWKNSVDAMDIL